MDDGQVEQRDNMVLSRQDFNIIMASGRACGPEQGSRMGEQ
jgi:hypothetical protein